MKGIEKKLQQFLATQRPHSATKASLAFEALREMGEKRDMPHVLVMMKALDTLHEQGG